MTIRSGCSAGPTRARLALSVLALSLMSMHAAAAPLASGLGPEVALAEPRDGFVGSLNVVPENGPAARRSP